MVNNTFQGFIERFFHSDDSSGTLVLSDLSVSARSRADRGEENELRETSPNISTLSFAQLIRGVSQTSEGMDTLDNLG